MEAKKSAAGRKTLPALEQKVAVIIYVKRKHAIKAKKDCLKVQNKYQ